MSGYGSVISTARIAVKIIEMGTSRMGLRQRKCWRKLSAIGKLLEKSMIIVGRTNKGVRKSHVNKLAGKIGPEMTK